MVLKHKGYGAYISCDDTPLDEFAFTKEDETTVSCYICSQAGKNFEIHVEDYGAIEESSDASYVNGKLPKSVFFLVDGKKAENLFSRHGNHACSTGTLTGADEIRLYLFQDLPTTDDEQVALINDSGHQDLGCLEVQIKRRLGSRHPSAPPVYGVVQNAIVHEKSKKMSAHCVGGGEIVKHTRKWSSPIQYDREPYVKFRFYYRRRDVLQAQGIMPPPIFPQPAASSPPQNTSVKREHEHDSDDEDSEDLEQIEAQLKLLQKIRAKKLSKKKARTNSGAVKREPVNRRVFSAASDEVIDLTL